MHYYIITLLALHIGSSFCASKSKIRHNVPRLDFSNIIETTHHTPSTNTSSSSSNPIPAKTSTKLPPIHPGRAAITHTALMNAATSNHLSQRIRPYTPTTDHYDSSEDYSPSMLPTRAQLTIASINKTPKGSYLCPVTRPPHHTSMKHNMQRYHLN